MVPAKGDKLYFSNSRLEKIREEKYRGWELGDPPHEELLMDLYVPRDSRLGHPGIPIPQMVSYYEMKRLSVFLATESMRQQYTQGEQT